jgi:hypothetical protein
MKLRWLVALAVGFALIWATVAFAGPQTPNGGDPDIWDRAKPPVRSAPRTPSISTRTAVEVDMVLFKVNLKQLGAPDKTKANASRLLALSK